ncbi:patatin-like phospholipase family protein [Pseudomonas sp. S75]|uniref:patatin-like phospholipase family protein n=1 Tax=unclassified Pseudomonas TaxID=196821 RepID=UPI0019059055|nr:MULTISPECIES: patatin-like phospholipase family protein [unclassified Pseudomonas]MBJ9974236.1 patatin-like phospholipase family protein [Pseudomonas sp. S30]MBK0151834.1 patatin-like phospholipase family protein [Pseudomonas sp. S75]
MNAAIHIRNPALTFKAGKRALAQIRERGLRAADVGVLPGAAGGPKPLGIQGLDLALFGQFLPSAPRQRSLIGASIGAWRFASACLDDPVAGLRRLGELYTEQDFARGVTPAQITQSCQRMLDDLLQGRDAQILANTQYRLNILVVKSHGQLAFDHRARLGIGLSAVIASNLLGRPRLARHFERVVLHDPRSAPPLDPLEDFPSRCLPLDLDNLRQGLLASGSIPMVMQGVRDLPGAGAGTYRDGGLLDYHLDLPYRGDDLVLYPHFTDKVVPGWFDKALPWRRGDATRLQNVLLMTPSPQYLAALPYGKLPDRGDFKRFMGDAATRKRYWYKAIAESQRLGDELLELVATGRLHERLQAL